MNPVTAYVGQNQNARLNVPAHIAYKYIDWEEGPWVMIPYAQLYPSTPEPEPILRGRDTVQQEWLKLHKPPKNRPHRMVTNGPWSILPELSGSNRLKRNLFGL